jgi:hypothetical protein
LRRFFFLQKLQIFAEIKISAPMTEFAFNQADTLLKKDRLITVYISTLPLVFEFLM